MSDNLERLQRDLDELESTDPAVGAAAASYDAARDKIIASGRVGSGAPTEPPLDLQELAREFERLAPSSLAARLDRDRPYGGQPHTFDGQRGRTEVKGITFRDLYDCFVRACYDASGLPVEQWSGTVYDLPWDDMDIVAVMQNLSCWVERYMGIYPNVPRLEATDG